MTGETIFKDNKHAIKIGVDEILKRQIAVAGVRNKYALLRSRVYQLSIQSVITYDKDNRLIQTKLSESIEEVLKGLDKLEHYEISQIYRSRA